MKIKITALSNHIYQFADKTVSDNSTGTWRGRIVNAPDISRNFSDLGSVASTLYIQLINHDLQIPLTEDLWNASIDVETDNGYKWTGKVSAYETNADGKMYITATETTAPEYSRYIPDEFARLVSIDEDVHMSALNVTIPTVIGGNANNPIPVKGILKSKSDAIYYLCVGEIHDIVNVRVGDTTMTKAQAEAKGYMCYTGSANQTNEPGIAYIQITDTSKRLNDDGSYVEIGAEVIGLKLGTHTVEECRNGARFLYWLLKTAASGVCGWGLGISTNDIDTASFETAITYVDLIGLKLDGVLYDNRSAQNWIDEICRAIRGTYEIGTDGKRRLAIDIASTSSYTYTKDNIELVRFGAGSFTGRVYNKGILNYSYNPITGMFMQSSQYQNDESISRIDEQLFEGESYLIRDAETAQKILEYTCKKSLVEANKILFNTRFLPENCRIGTVITINYPEKGMNNSLFKITSLQIGDHINRIEAVKYDENIYTSGSVSPTVAWQNEEPIISPVSVDRVSNLTLNSSFDILPDGTGIASITGTYTMPNGNYITAVVEYGETNNPSVWYSIGLLKTDSFKISPVKVNTLYSVRVRLVTSTGHSDYVTGTINTVGDSIPPLEPTISVKATDKTVTIQCGLDNPPYDMGGFQIYRKKSTDPDNSFAPIGCIAVNRGYASLNRGYASFVDYVEDYITYNYKAKSYDRSGNLSTNFSKVASITVTGIQANDVAATALAMPTGSILRLSAKNCTTASIAEVDGVKDVSGNGNHGQAFGGVSVVSNDIIGKCFNFDGINSQIKVSNASMLAKINSLKSFTLSARIVVLDSINMQRVFGLRNNFGSVSGFFYFSGNTVYFYDRLLNSDSIKGLSYTVEDSSKPHLYLASIDYENGTAVLSVDGEDVEERSDWFVGTKSDVDEFRIAFATGDFNGLINDVRLYPRALSKSERKCVSMFPDDVTFGQLTADLIGANIIKAFNLVLTENIITQTAQIQDSIITNAKIANLDAGKITTGTLDSDRIAANSVTAEKINVSSGLPARLLQLNLKGCSATVGSEIPDLSAYHGCYVIGTGNNFNGINYSTRGWFAVSSSSNGNNKRRIINKSGTTLTLGTSFAFGISYYKTTETGASVQPILFEASDGTNNNKISIYITTDRYVAVDNYNSSGTKTTIKLGFVGSTEDMIIVSCSEGTWTSYIADYASNSTVVKITSSTTSTRTALTATQIAFGNTYAGDASRGSSAHRFSGANIFNGAISESQANYCLKFNTLNSDESGQITADRIAAGSIETRHLTADSIVGKTFQTASNTGTSNAAGVRFNSSGIQGFDGSAKTFDLNTNGKLTATDVDLTGSITANNGKIGIWNITSNGGLSATDNPNNNVKFSITCNLSNSTTNKLDISHQNIILQNVTNSSVNKIVTISTGGISITNPNSTTSAPALSVAGVAVCPTGWSTTCDESVKKDIKDVSTLDKLKSIRVKKFKYSQKAIQEKEWKKEQALKTEENLKKGIKTEEEPMPEFKDDENAPDYIMTMAGEFNKAFGVDNGNEESINYTNAIGVALRAIQELAEQVDELKAQLKIQQDERMKGEK